MIDLAIATKAVETVHQMLKQDEKLSKEERVRVVDFYTEYSAWLRRTAAALRGTETVPLGLLRTYVIWMGGRQKAHELLSRASRRGLRRRSRQIWATLKRLTNFNPRATSAETDVFALLKQEWDLFSAEHASFSSLLAQLDEGSQKMQDREGVANQFEELASQFETWAVVLCL